MRHFVLMLSIAFAGACGGSAPTSDTTPQHTSQPTYDEAEPEVSETPEREVPEEPVARGPGRLRIVNRVGGSETGGTVRVLDSSGEVVHEGTSGDTFTVPSGTYQVAGSITDAAVLLDTPSRDVDGAITVLAGQEQTVQVDFPVARVRLRVTAHGRPVTNWRADLRRQGTSSGAVIQLRASEQHTAISPGRYDATLLFGNERIEVRGVIFQGGATMDVPVNVD